MEKPTEEKNMQETSKSCSITSSISPHKKGIVETNQVEEEFVSPTPLKTKEPSRIKSKEELVELPEKYGTLLEFFDRMTSSLRLLRLRKKTPSFNNISSQVEVLTGRIFQVKHLAQIKNVLPEAVHIEKILLHDLETKCMKSDMKIDLLFDVVKDRHEESSFVALSSLFSSRLRDFHMRHPEGFDIPEAELPEPFNQGSITTSATSISKDLSNLCESKILNSSHLPLSFRRHFHEKAVVKEMEKTDLHSPTKSACVVNKETEKVRPLPDSSSTASMNECDSTPVKLLAGSNSVLVETPVQSTPMRSISPTRSVLTCEDEKKTTISQQDKQSSTTAKKSLDFYGIDGEDTFISHKQISVGLSDLVLLIHQIFRSVHFRPITKQELVQKIIMNNCEIDDISDVERQMGHLEKLVPDWFYKKLAPSGDLLYHVKKVSDLSSVCERIDVV